jgi:pimeloyl-ACP methyl ester carboxylesterase
MRRQPPGVLTADFAACDAYRNGAAAAAAVRCPALLVLGGNDAMTPARSGRALAATIAGAKVVEFAGVGHFVMAEVPDQTLDTLRDFVPTARAS